MTATLCLARAFVLLLNAAPQAQTLPAFPKPDTAVYAAVLGQARQAVETVWGDLDGWVDICGTGTKGQAAVLSLDPRLRELREDGLPELRFRGEISTEVVTAFVARGLVDRACESRDRHEPCIDSTATMTLSLSEARKVKNNRVHISLLMARGPNCPNRPERGGFAAELLYILAPDTTGWRIEEVRMLWIT